MKVKIGSVFGSHIVYGIHGNTNCIARPISPDGDYVVWHIDADGKGVWGGLYFPDQMEAEWEYASRCFPWFQDNVTFAENEDDNEIDETFEEFPDIP